MKCYFRHSPAWGYLGRPHRRSQGVHWVHVHPQGGEKILGQITGESCKCTPEAEQEFNFLENWGDLDGWRGYSGSFSVCFESDDEKRSSTFLVKKSAPPDKILATPMDAPHYHATRTPTLTLFRDICRYTLL